ncbi:MAG: hypothetical protein HYW37_02550 [Candidatus Colwellbacteria bacterium]|nr:hypothetical protein [Candidatus Colwellbacteria bacterium]
MEDFKKQLLLNTGVTAGVLLVIIGLVVYLGKDIRDKGEIVFLNHSELTAQLQAVKDLAKLREAAKTAGPSRQLLDKALPKRDGLFGLPKEFERMAADKKVGFSFRFGQEGKPDPAQPSKIAFEMTAQGAYNDLLEFVKSVESSPYYINIAKLDVTRTGEKFNAAIGGEIYFNE